MTAKPKDQAELIAFAEELEALMAARGVGGTLMLVSPTAAAWRHVLPEWAAIVPNEKRGGWIVQIRGSTPAGHERTEATMHFLGVLRDMARDCTELFGRCFRMAKMQIEMGGGEVDHAPFAGGAERPDPMGGGQGGGN